MDDSEIHVINLTKCVLQVRVDCDRVILSVDNTITFDANILGGGLNISNSRNEECDVFYNVNTFDAFTTIEVNGNSTFRLQNNGSWDMIAENHPITKRCIVIISRSIHVRQKYSNCIQAPITQKLYEICPKYPFLLWMLGMIPFLFGPCICDSDTYYPSECRFGRIVVFNKSSKNIWVNVDADRLDVKKVTTRNGYNLDVAPRIESLGVALGSTHTSSNSTKVRNIYYRANQGSGFTLVRKNTDNVVDPTVFYLKSPDKQYYLSIDYENENGKLVQYYYKHPDRLLDVEEYVAAYIPKITVFDRADGIEVVIEKQRFSLDNKCSKYCHETVFDKNV